MHNKILISFCFSLLLLNVTGCFNKNDGRCDLKGTISLDGVPIEEGYIEFIPEAPAPSVAIVGAQSLIRNGTFAIEGDLALLPGTYKVRIESQRMVDKKTGKFIPSDDKPEDFTSYTKTNLVPAKYNAASTLTYTVEKGNSNTFDLDIKTR